jgi:hypothetical protein
VDAWLTTARDELARIADLPVTELELDADAERAILELARIAAHESGERMNAPLVCFLAGRASQGGRVDVERMLAAVERAG